MAGKVREDHFAGIVADHRWAGLNFADGVSATRLNTS
jgi:hypothetical protein